MKLALALFGMFPALALAAQPAYTAQGLISVLIYFVIVGLIFLHIWALHVPGANNPLGIDAAPADKIPFFPYYVMKDVFGLGVFVVIYFIAVFWFPNALGEPDNYIKANPLQTPEHIVPEWYYLPFYAILRSIPNKLLGVILMFGSILILFALPWLDTSRVRSGNFRPVFRIFFVTWIIDVLILGWVGSQPPEGIIPTIGLIGTIWYFIHFAVILPVVGWLETPKPLPASISQPVQQAAE